MRPQRALARKLHTRHVEENFQAGSAMCGNQWQLDPSAICALNWHRDIASS